jgi:GntR family transcriptional regulator, transcriptional repressor for pyruvate dehydrogenase complex
MVVQSQPPSGPTARPAVGSPTSLRVGNPINAPKTAELIAQQLRRQIVRGTLRAGESLPPEADLMAQFAVSRPTLREAFRILETESLITVRRGSRGGALVTTPDFSVASRYLGSMLQMKGTTLGDLFEARIVLEAAAAGMMAASRTEQDLADMRACVDQLKDMAKRRTSDGVVTEAWADEGQAYRFHELLLERAGNKTIEVQGMVLRDIVTAHLRRAAPFVASEADYEGRLQRTIRSYAKMISLIEAKDAAGAERHWRAHMKATASILLQGELSTMTVIELFE